VKNFVTFTKHKMSVTVWVYFWILCSVPMHYVFVLFLCQYHSGFVIMALFIIWIRYYDTSSIDLLPRIVLVMWSLLCFHRNYKIIFLLLWRTSLKFWVAMNL
jgi:hypothetical protein